MPKILVIDDDRTVLHMVQRALAEIAEPVLAASSADEGMELLREHQPDTVLLDIMLPDTSGLALFQQIREIDRRLPIIFITGHGDIPMAVEAMRRGAIDFIRKPFREQDLLDRINEALAADLCARRAVVTTQQTLQRVASLTAREYDVFEGVAEGKMNKVIGHELGISERTVEVHRSQVMKKLGVKTLAQLVRVKIETERDSIEN